MKIKDLPQRFQDRITIQGSCWIFRGDPSSNGYQRCWWQGTRFMTHRLFFEWSNPSKDIRHLELDHLCETRACCNPSHMDPVDRQTNLKRRYRRRKKCPTNQNEG